MRNRISLLLVIFALSAWSAFHWGGSSVPEPLTLISEIESTSDSAPASTRESTVMRNAMQQPHSASLYIQPDCIPVKDFACKMQTSAGDMIALEQDASGAVDFLVPHNLVQVQIQGEGWERADFSAEELVGKKEIIVKALRKVTVTVFSKRTELPVRNFRLTFLVGTLDSDGNFNPGWMKKTITVKDSHSVTLGGYSRQKGYQSHFQIRIEADGYPTFFSAAIPIERGERWTTLELRLDEASESSFSVSGVVLNRNGMPIEGATCSLVPEPISWEYFASIQGKVELAGFIDPRKADLDASKTDSNGEFQIASQRSSEYSLLVEIVGRPFFRMDLGALAPGRVPNYLTITMEDASSLLVRLTYPEEVNPDNYSMKLSHGVLFEAKVSNPSPGIREYDFIGVEPGNAELTLSYHAVESVGQASFLVLEKRDIQIHRLRENIETFNLDPTLQNDGISVEVPILDGIQYRHWTVLLAEAEHGGQERQALVDASGVANFENITQGRWDITGIAFHEEAGIFVMGFGSFDTQEKNVSGVVSLQVAPSKVHLRFLNAPGTSTTSALRLFAKTQDSPHQRFLAGLAQGSLPCRSPFTILGLPDGTYSASSNGKEGKEWTLDANHGLEVSLEF